MIDTVLLKVASRCNIDCTYCYIYKSPDENWKKQPKQMTEETIEKTCLSLKNLYDFQKKGFAIVIHGGEPFLLKEDRMRLLFSKLRAYLRDSCSISIQSNGTLFNERLFNLCKEYNVTLSISLDGPAVTNDKNRIDFKGNGTFSSIIDNINLIKKLDINKSVFTGCLSVIDVKSDAKVIYKFFKDLGVPSVNFLLRDGNHDTYPYQKTLFESTEYGLWLEVLWNEYFADSSSIPIALFDNYVKVFLGGYSAKEGSGDYLYGILIIDTNGDIKKNDTLKSSYEEADYFSSRPNIHDEKAMLELIQSSEFSFYKTMQIPLTNTCKDCSYMAICGGGMPLYRWSEKNQYDNVSVYCNDHKYIIDSIRNTLKGVGFDL